MKKIIAIALVLMLCVSALSVAAFAADTVTIYAKVLDGWTNVGCYTWNPEDLGGWPGSKMTLGSDGWYKITMPGTHTTVIINSDQGQTVNIPIEAGKDVWITVNNEKSGTNYKAAVSYDGGKTEEVPTGPSAYYVAGSSALCGVEWDPGADANKMTKGADGIWTKTYTGVAAGSYALKVTIGNWDTSWGKDGQDYPVEVAEANSTVTVKFNPDDETVTVEVNGSSAGGEVVTPPPAVFDAYYVAGTAGLCNGVEWDPAAAVNAMTKGDDGIWTITFSNVPAGEHKLKVTAGSWDNCWGDAEGGDADGNVVINLEEAAEKITVKFNPATNFVSVYNGENPLTNDVSLAGVAVALLAATAGVVALVGMKKKED